MADKKYYKLDHEKHTITVDMAVNPTKEEEKAVELYTKSGYKLLIKSQARAEKMTEKSDRKTIDDYKELLKDDAAAQKKFIDICNGDAKNDRGNTGLWAAKRWYRIEILHEKSKTELAEEEKAKNKGKKK